MSAYWPFIVIGIFTGGLYGLAAMGMVLTYKTVGVFNFAYGAIAMFCAFTYWQLHDQWGLSAWVAMPILFLIVAPVIGVILEGLFRPLSGAAIEVVIVVSLGVLAALSAAAGLIWPQDEHLQAIFPISTFRLGSHAARRVRPAGHAPHLLSMAAVLWGLLRHTRFGTQTRAVVDNPDLSDMIGVHGDNVRRVAWILSSVFAALVGHPHQPVPGSRREPAGAGGDLRVRAGRARDPLRAAGGLPRRPRARDRGQRDVEVVQLGDRGQPRGGAPLPRCSSFCWSCSGHGSRRRARAPWPNGCPRCAPSETVRRLRWSVGSLRIERGLAVGLGGFVLALLVPLAFPGPKLDFLTQGFIYAVIALTLVVLTGWAGQISLAQFSFVGVGAFTAGHLAGAHGQHFLFAVLMGMLFAAPLGIIVGLVSLRLSGLYLALATLAFALVMDNVVFNRSDVSGGQTGITVPRPHFFGMSFTGRAAMYELAVVVFGAGRDRGLRAAPGPHRTAAAHRAGLPAGRVDPGGQPDRHQDRRLRRRRHGGRARRLALRRLATGDHAAGLHVVRIARAAARRRAGRALAHLRAP